ncbi:repressor of RNA polymerase III transcription maf1 [Ceratobasidium sp. AG-Ba]|nr:repressor of RNA polymerase III transcription maf1 [Ceratobasidium sp. AG-Ba]
MKFLDLPELAQLSSQLSIHHSAECAVRTRIEAYSCKSITKEKKMFRNLDSSFLEQLSLSPPDSKYGIPVDSAFGPLDKSASRKVLYLLIATLNVAFPDHDFSEAKADHFCKETDGAGVLNSLSNALLSPSSSRSSSILAPTPRSYSSYPLASRDGVHGVFPQSLPTSSSPVNHFPTTHPPIVSGTHPHLYQILDSVISLANCDVYSYSPDMESDPHADDSEDSASASSGSPGDDDTFDFEPDGYTSGDLACSSHLSSGLNLTGTNGWTTKMNVNAGASIHAPDRVCPYEVVLAAFCGHLIGSSIIKKKNGCFSFQLGLGAATHLVVGARTDRIASMGGREPLVPGPGPQAFKRD